MFPSLAGPLLQNFLDYPLSICCSHILALNSLLVCCFHAMSCSSDDSFSAQTMKNYYTRQSEFLLARAKLRESETAKVKAEKEGLNKRGNEKRMKNLERVKQKVNFY